MKDKFEPTPENSTIDGNRWGWVLDWDDLNWAAREWRELGGFWVVPLTAPHVSRASLHRVRQVPPDIQALWADMDGVLARADERGTAPWDVIDYLEDVFENMKDRASHAS